MGKIHLGVKVKPEGKQEYPKAVDYFVFPPDHPQYAELVKIYGEKPRSLNIFFPIDDEDKIASQYYRLYSNTRGLICKGDGEVCDRLIDVATGALPGKDSKDVKRVEMTCDGRACPDYGKENRGCGEVMVLQFCLIDAPGFGVWQIDTGSFYSIMNINDALALIRSIYKHVDMVSGLTLTLEPKEVTPEGGRKKTVRILNIRSENNMLEHLRHATIKPLELMTGVVEDSNLTAGDDAELPEAGKEPIYSDLPKVTEDPEPEPTIEQLKADGIPLIGKDEELPPGRPGAKLRIRETGDIIHFVMPIENANNKGMWIPEEKKPDLPTGESGDISGKDGKWEKPESKLGPVGPRTTLLPDGRTAFPANPKDGDKVVIKDSDDEYTFSGEKSNWKQTKKGKKAEPQTVETEPVKAVAEVTAPAVGTGEGEAGSQDVKAGHSGEGEPVTLPEFFKWLQAHGKKFGPTWFYRNFSFTQEEMQVPANIPKAITEVKELAGWTE